MADASSVIVEVTQAVEAVATGVPVLIAAFMALKGIWTAANPGKTEADFIDFLQSTAEADASLEAAWLTAKGYQQTPEGHWLKP